MIPTALGAFLGMSLGLPALVMSSPIMSIIAFLVISFALLFAIDATQNSVVSIPTVGVFTLFMGAWLSTLLTAALGLSNGAGLIAMAAIGTVAITWACSLYAITTTQDFSAFGGYLFGSVIGLIVISLLNIWLQLPLLSLIIAALALLIFSAFLVFDVQRIVSGGETNYVMATVSIYLNVFNIFTSLLQILMELFGED
jgi:FtsH-binding integral membrane protein